MAIRSIPDVKVSDPNTREVLEAMKEIIEVLLGRRGAVTDHLIKYGDINMTTAAYAEGVTAITVGAGADTIDLAALNTSLVILKTEIDTIANLLNVLRLRFIP